MRTIYKRYINACIYVPRLSLYRTRRIFELIREGKSIDYIAADINMPKEYVKAILDMAMIKQSPFILIIKSSYAEEKAFGCFFVYQNDIFKLKAGDFGFCGRRVLTL